MSKITRRDCFIKNTLTANEMVNVTLLNSLDGKLNKLFLPLAVCEGKKPALEGTVEGLISFEKRFKNAVSTEMVLDLAYQVVQVVKSCEAANVAADNIDLSVDMIFFEPDNGRAHFIYWPIVNNKRAYPPQKFFRSLPDNFVFNSPVINEYLDFWNTTDAFSLTAFENLLLKLMGKEVSESRSLYARLSNTSFESETDKGKKDEDQASREWNPFNAVQGLSEAYIVDCVTHERFYIKDAETTIGSDSSQKIVIKNNYVSRKHAKIIEQNGEYYIVDVGSHNGTKIDNERITVGTPRLLKHGTIIQLANEVFMFQLKKEA